jgi:hypothetical protein
MVTGVRSTLLLMIPTGRLDGGGGTVNFWRGQTEAAPQPKLAGASHQKLGSPSTGTVRTQCYAGRAYTRPTQQPTRYPPVARGSLHGGRVAVSHLGGEGGHPHCQLLDVQRTDRGSSIRSTSHQKLGSPSTGTVRTQRYAGRAYARPTQQPTRYPPVARGSLHGGKGSCLALGGRGWPGPLSSF